MKRNTVRIFSGISKDDYAHILSIGGARTAIFDKNQTVFRAKEEVNELAEVISGCVNINKVDFWGNNVIVYQIMPGEIFAGSYAICNSPLEVEAVAASECKILFINIRAILSSADTNRTWYVRLLRNLLFIESSQNIMLSGRITVLTSKSIRTRVMLYLSSEAAESGNDAVTIPFNRQQMADYLSVERTALSKELGKMKKDGLIDYNKNAFHLIRQATAEY